MPLPPPADRSDIDMSDVRVTVVPLAKPFDEVEMPLQGDRIIHVGDRESSPFVFGDQFFASDLVQPPGMVWLVPSR